MYPRSVLLEYEGPIPQNKGASCGLPIKNRDFLENECNDFDQISIICGDRPQK
jgi:hypothetical protein